MHLPRINLHQHLRIALTRVKVGWLVIGMALVGAVQAVPPLFRWLPPGASCGATSDTLPC